MNIYTKTALLGIIAGCSLMTANTVSAGPFDDSDSVIKTEALKTSSDYVSTFKVDENYNLVSIASETCYYGSINLNDPSLYPCEGTVNCQNIQNVRASYWGTIMEHYAPGTKVTIVAKEGDWYKIEYSGNGGYAYLHYSLVDTKYAPAYDGPHPYAYGDGTESSASIAKRNGFGAHTKSKITTKENFPIRKPVVSKKDDDSSSSSDDDNSDSPYTNLSSAEINGPEVPDILLEAIEKAKKTQWFTTKDKCLQYIGTVAYYAGAHVSKKNSIYPHNAYKADKTYRGKKIPELEKLAKQGKLLPGMLVHVKVAYDMDPAYNPSTNAHHWFMYAGLKDGVPMWCDCLRGGKLQTTDEVNRNMINGRAKLPQYAPYGNIRRVTAIYDPFADQRQ